MNISVEASRCPRNHPCPVVRLCPAGAISQAGFSAPVIDMAKCTGCGRCVRACGYGAFKRT